jgi:cysteine desulfurase/selenocysteine lyase
LNLVAQTYGRTNLGDGDEVLISKLEHHSNIVPWQIVCDQTGAQLRVAPINDRGELIVDEFTKLLTNKTRVVAFNHVSNSLGTINPAKELIVKAHEAGAVVVIDGAQAAPHMRVDVRDLDADFYAFSGHKAFGPTGIGALYGKPELLEAMPPYQGGGDMIKSVTFEKTVYNDIPYRFEAGTPNIADTIGLGAAIDYLASIDFDGAVAHEHDLLVYGTQALESIDGLRLIGTAGKKASVLSFVLKGIHPYDASPVLDHQGVAVRTGHHCTQPVMDHFGIPSTFRASLAFYNTKEEIDALAKALEKVKKMFA